MEQALSVAKVFYDSYYDCFHEYMDEMKMHKLMYLVQREALMTRKDVLFSEKFYGWKFGPVLKSVREEYHRGKPFSHVSGDVLSTAKSLVKSVLDRYGAESSWSLSRMSHGEFSWKCARKGLRPDENGDVPLDVNAMRMDAARELAARGTVNT